MDIPFVYQLQADVLTEENRHHLIQVLRLKEGDQFTITNGRGILYTLLLETVQKKNCTHRIVSEIEVPPARSHLHIGIAFTKNTARIEWFLEKAVELGVEEITPLQTARSVRTHAKRDRLEKIIQSAMLQSQQCYLPVLHEPIPFQEFVTNLQGPRYIAHCLPDERRSLQEELLGKTRATVCIGPEGDFSPEEIQFALQHELLPIELGLTRLRTETAGMYVSSVFRAVCRS